MKTNLMCGALLALFCVPATAQCPLPSTRTTFAPSGGGDAVDLDGGTAIVGAPFATNPGSAYIHERDSGGAGAWGRVTELTASDGQSGDKFGSSVAVHGDLAVVGAPDHGNQYPGAVYVFERDSGGPDQWGEVAKIDANLAESFGNTVAVWGDTVLIGAPDAGSLAAGAAYIYERDSGGQWSLATRFLAPIPGLFDSFGFDVALCGDTAAVSEPQDGKGWFPGSVFIYERDFGGAGNWGKVRRIRSSDKADGDWFGQSVALAGDTIVIGARDHNHAGVEDTGAAYVFERDLGGLDNWGERAELVPSGVSTNDHFGSAVAFDGDLALVSDERFQIGRSVYFFERHAGGADVWSETGALVGPAASLAGFGSALALEATTALIGDPAADEAYAYELSLTQAFTSYCTAGTSASGCRASMSACGSASATASAGFRLQADGVEGGKDAIFLYGANGRQAAPWGNGSSFRCVVPPFSRGILMSGVGAAGSCDGFFTLDLNARWCQACPKPGQNPGAGAVIQAQLWYRDPQSTSNQSTSLSDAIEFSVAP